MSAEIQKEIISVVDSIVETHESLKRKRVEYTKLTADYKTTAFDELIEDIKVILATEHNPKLQPFIDSLSKITHFNNGAGEFRRSIVARYGEDIYWSLMYKIEIGQTHSGGRTTKNITWCFQQGLLTDSELVGLNYMISHFKQINDLINNYEHKLASVVATSTRVKC
jgi:hypothetical protein